MGLEIGDLPEEVICVILKEVIEDADSFHAVAQVCSAWRRLAYDDEFRFFRGVLSEAQIFLYDWKYVKRTGITYPFSPAEEAYIWARQKAHTSQQTHKLMAKLSLLEWTYNKCGSDRPGTPNDDLALSHAVFAEDCAREKRWLDRANSQQAPRLQ